MNNNFHNDWEINLKKIAKIIDRQESNHFKWYVIHLSVLAFTITIYSFAFQSFVAIKFLLKIIIFIIIGLSINVISFISFWNSWKYLLIGRAFRESEKVAIQKKEIPNFNWEQYKTVVKKKYGFVFWTEIVISLFILISTVVIPIFHLI